MFEIAWLWHMSPFELERLPLNKLAELGNQGIRIAKKQAQR